MKKNILVLLSLFAILVAFKTDKPAYVIYNSKGKQVKFEKMVKQAAEADVVFFGEQHNNPISHWLQLELTQALYQAHTDQLVLGAEMVETDNQDELNLYLEDIIDADSLKVVARMWPNFNTDYKPLVDLAKEHKLPFIGTNVPRRYASMVFRGGFEALDTLPAAEKQFMAPLPIDYDPELPGYQKMLEMMSGMPGHQSANFPKAQAIKDATMAWSIAQNWKAGKHVIHYNGSFHSDNFEGIVWYLKRFLPEVKIVTITTLEQDVLPKRLSEEDRSMADFMVVVPVNMTKTY